jgi:uncharacterized repeat protein (TIGR03803 family)
MSHLRRHGFLITAIFIAVMVWAFATAVHAQIQYQFKLLHGFNESLTDGNGPEGPVVFDQEGNLYGATFSGGAYTDGTVYELTPGSDGQWTETILHNFINSLTDGANPVGVVIDSAGNLFGATSHGGSKSEGTVFELSPGANGQWTESVLWNFCSLPNCADGAGQSVPPIRSSSGDLFGATTAYPGTVFELTPSAKGWALTTLYTFCSLPNCADGEDPMGSLTLDSKGDLYGETTSGGSCSYDLGCGVVFTLRPQANGLWQETVLQDFGTSEEGIGAGGGVTLRDHALYGTTQDGGQFGCANLGCGTVFELTHIAGNGIHEQLLHDFGEQSAQGIAPYAAVTFDPHGDLFGITLEGGSPTCECGIVYGMKPQDNGKWGFEVLHSFVGTDGSTPNATPTLDSKGNLYGTTATGGPGEGGVVFELSPTAGASK